MPNELTPREIVAELDKYIIGQTDAKRTVAIALRNRWRRRNAPDEMKDEIMPSNIIMIGPTGVGKTEIARRLARLADAPFIKVEATKFTEVGYVGRDVDSMIRDLADIAVNMVREEHQIKVQGRARELAEERILDELLPDSKPTPANAQLVPGPGFVMSTPNEGSEDNNTEDAGEIQARRERTRTKFRDMLRKGDLDAREIEIEVSADQSPMLQVFGPMGLEEMGMNIQEMFGNLGPRRSKKRRVNVQEALELLTKEEAQKLIDMDKVTQEALERVQQSGIVFIDEIDKVAVRSGSNRGGPDVSREGVQRDLLPIVEGSNVTTKHGMVKTDHILFVASGAFHVSKPSDLIPEMQGRFPIRVELLNLNEDDFFKILTQPKNALLKQYQALLHAESVNITFTEDAVHEIARTAAQVNSEIENIGARRLHTIMTTLLEDILFEADGSGPSRVKIDGARVKETLNSIIENRDLSQYIL